MQRELELLREWVEMYDQHMSEEHGVADRWCEPDAMGTYNRSLALLEGWNIPAQTPETP